jgi:DNA-binding transcriptional ArsR family regulator
MKNPSAKDFLRGLLYTLCDLFLPYSHFLGNSKGSVQKGPFPLRCNKSKNLPLTPALHLCYSYDIYPIYRVMRIIGFVEKGGKMADLAFIAPAKTTTITFDVEPAYNVLSSLLLLDERLPGFTEWVHHTASELPEEVLRTNKLVGSSSTLYFEDISWPSFLAWVDHLETLDPVEMRDTEVDELLEKAASYLEDAAYSLPSSQDLLADRKVYLKLIEEVMSCKDHPFNRTHSERMHELLLDPPARKELMISHLRNMWDEILEKEWEHNLPMLRDCVATFRSLDLDGMSTRQILQLVFDRDVPDEWDEMIEALEKIILIPSPHIGPYLLTFRHSENTARMLFGARTPKGANVQSLELSRSEIIARMSALANDTRLSILHLLSQEGELSSQDIISRLKLSQSAASRHLQHLKATGYIVEQRQDGAKFFRPNPDRIGDLFTSLKEFLQ